MLDVSFWTDLLGKAAWAALSFLSAWLLAQYKKYKAKSHTTETEMQLIKDALKHTLRGVLRDDYVFLTKKGYCTYLEKDEFDKTYKIYHEGLGGNGVATSMRDVIMELPYEGQVDKPHSQTSDKE